MRHVTRCALLVLLLGPILTGAELWVDAGSGNDANPGTSSSPLRSISRAAAIADAGDVITVRYGVYDRQVENGDKWNHIYINRSGTSSSPITFRGQRDSQGRRPLVVSDSVTAFSLNNARHVVIEGFELMAGDGDPLNIAGLGGGWSHRDKRGIGTAGTCTHIVVRDNYVRDFGSNGIAFGGADQLLIEDNVVEHCGFLSASGNSGISVIALVDDPAAAMPELGGYGVVIRRNVSRYNVNLQGFKGYHHHLTDGNGIIVDYAHQTRGVETYSRRILVENNRCYGNGGRGINVFHSRRVDVVANTCFDNLQTPRVPQEYELALWRDGEIRVASSDDVVLLDNLCYASAGSSATMTVEHSSRVRAAGNLHWIAGGGGTPHSASDLVADPRLVNPDFLSLAEAKLLASSTNPLDENGPSAGLRQPSTRFATPDLALRSDSPAIDAAVSGLDGATITDHDALGTARPQGGGHDIGAIERVATSSEPNQAPLADAGSDRSVVDDDGNGGEDVSLDGRASSDADGSIASWEWSVDGTVIATGATPNPRFAVGTTEVVLTVTDDDGASASDRLIVSVEAASTGDGDEVSSGGGISREWWTGVDGHTIDHLIAHAGYPDQSDGSDVLARFQAVSWSDPGTTRDWGDDYGQRLRGYLVPPTSGDYVFWISGDDQCRLLLSDGEDPSRAVAIAWVDGWTAALDWDVEAGQRSAAVRLEAGKRYYVEALHKEGWGGDSLAVGWAKPGQDTTAPSEIVPGSALEPYAGGGTTDTSGEPVSDSTTGGGEGLDREWWTGISGGSIAHLTGSSSYPDQPDGSDVLTAFEAVSWSDPTQTRNFGDSYGQRIRGYLVPPTSGDYVFWIASDDGSSLRLGSDQDPAGAVEIARVGGWTHQYEWDKYSDQRSAAIRLEAGVRYYVEALHKEAGGGDHLAVAWAKPGQDTTAPSEIVPGSALRALSSGDDEGAVAEPVRTGYRLAPEADAFVRDGAWRGTNYGQDHRLVAKAVSDPDYVRESYLRFDCSALPPGIESAVLELVVINAGSDATGTDFAFELVSDSGDGWSEDGITFANAPGGAEDSVVVRGRTIGETMSIDVTALVQATMDHDPDARCSIRVRGLQQGSQRFIVLGSDEHDSVAAPALVVVGLASNG